MVDKTCIFCGHPVDTNNDFEYRKAMPKGIHSRMSHGVRRDKDGRWFHLNVWQCIHAEEVAKLEKVVDIYFPS